MRLNNIVFFPYSMIGLIANVIGKWEIDSIYSIGK